MGRLNRIVGKLVRKHWSPEQIGAMVGPYTDVCLGHAAEEAVRECAASGGVASRLLISALERGEIDGALVCSSAIDQGRVRPQFSIATTAEDVLAARGSTYVATRFARDAGPLIEAFEGKLAVVGLPCDLTWLAKVRESNPEVDEKVVLTVGLLCGHSSQPELVDRVVGRLAREAAASPDAVHRHSPDGGKAEVPELESFRFRVGHWRGRLRAAFDNGVTLDKPFSSFSLYQNLYYYADKKCLFCGDHFAYEADIAIGDVWRPELKSDPVKHAGVLVRTERGRDALAAAAAEGALVLEPMSPMDLVEGQARTAPFHYNVSARAKAGKAHGLTIPDRLGAPVVWHEHLTAWLVLANWRVSRSTRWQWLVWRTPRRLLKLYLVLLKGLETLPGSVAPDPDAPRPGPRVAVIAGTIAGNRGAEAMLTTCIGQVRELYPNARFFAYSYYPESDRRLNLDPAVAVHSSTPAALVLVHFPFALLGGLFRVVRLRFMLRFLPRSVRDLASCDALLDVAGVSFIDGREKFLPFNILTIWPAMLLGVPVVKMSQALGPFEHRLNRLAARLFLPRCTRVFARGDSTTENLRALGLPEPPLDEAADGAFLHTASYALSSENPSHAEELLTALASHRSDGRTVVGICPSSVIAGKAAESGWDYPGALAELVRGALDDGHAVLLFPNATRERTGEKLRNNDLPVIAAVLERLDTAQDSGHVLAVTHDLNAASIKSLVEACDAVLVSRFHAMVGALSSGVPVGVLGWSHKYLEVMEQFGLGDFVLDHGEGQNDALRGLLDRLLASRNDVRARIQEHLPAVRTSSARQFEFVAELLGTRD